MATVKGKQFYLNTSSKDEARLNAWMQTLPKGSYSSATVRLMLAGLYLERLDPSLVDLLGAELNKSTEPSFEFLERAAALLKLSSEVPNSQNNIEPSSDSNAKASNPVDEPKENDDWFNDLGTDFQ